MSYLEAKMHQIRFRLGGAPAPAVRSLERSKKTTYLDLMGLLLRREDSGGKGKRGEKRGGKGK